MVEGRGVCMQDQSEAFLGNSSSREAPARVAATPVCLSVMALGEVPIIGPDDDLAEVIVAALYANGIAVQSGDIIVLAQKIVSKAEGRQVDLATVAHSEEALVLAGKTRKDPRLVELVLSESEEVLRAKPDVLIVRHRLGWVMANAGIDQSNIDHEGGVQALLLPVDPDRTCLELREALKAKLGVDVGVMIIDSLGRAWRKGTTGTAIGVSGVAGLLDLRGQMDIHGRRLETSELGLADEVAAAASLMMGQAGEARPIALVRGLPYADTDGCAADLVRPRSMDLFQ